MWRERSRGRSDCLNPRRRHSRTLAGRLPKHALSWLPASSAKPVSRPITPPYYAVQEAQALTGQRVAKTHGGIVGAFGRMAVAVDDREAGRLFAGLRDNRIEIQYEHETATPEEAAERIVASERVIGVVERFLAEAGSAEGPHPQPGPMTR